MKVHYLVFSSHPGFVEVTRRHSWKLRTIFFKHNNNDNTFGIIIIMFFNNMKVFKTFTKTFLCF
jgi:hypothetical protein